MPIRCERCRKTVTPHASAALDDALLSPRTVLGPSPATGGGSSLAAVSSRAPHDSFILLGTHADTATHLVAPVEQRQQTGEGRPRTRSNASSSSANRSTPHLLSVNTESSGASAPIWSRLTTVATVSEMTDAGETQHPLCIECTRLLTGTLDKQVKDAKTERDCYNEYLALDSHEISSTDPAELAEAEQRMEQQLRELEEQERQAMAELEELERQEAQLAEEAEQLEQESCTLDEMEAAYWATFNSYQIDLQAFMNERDSLNARYSYAGRQLEKLKKTNVYNDAFRIWHDGHFGTINGLRLGRLSSQPVDWAEINAAWGQACLLLDTLSKKLSFEFKGYKLIPLGSFSKIERLQQDRGVYELYNTTDLHLGRLFFNRRFDTAMQSFLACLAQLGDYCESLDDDFRLPYRIVKDRIGEVSIRLPFNQDEVWTKACRYMLTNCKWILAFVTKRDLSSR
ncbi:Vacuolar protein sorting-associated protein atg6 [Sorochytrium milnesiophthora]